MHNLSDSYINEIVLDHNFLLNDNERIFLELCSQSSNLNEAVWMEK